MPRYTKKPVTIEARQWDGSNAVDLLSWIEPEARQEDQSIIIPTLEGDHEASLGDWIICGVKGEFYPCKPDIFAATYEPAGAERATMEAHGAALETARALTDKEAADLISRRAVHVGAIHAQTPEELERFLRPDAVPQASGEFATIDEAGKAFLVYELLVRPDRIVGVGHDPDIPDVYRIMVRIGKQYLIFGFPAETTAETMAETVEVALAGDGT